INFSNKMNILSIETSCDETAIALLNCSGGLRNPKIKVVKNIVATQIKIHQKFGGVVPNLAKREHKKNLPILLDKISKFLNSKIKILRRRRIRLWREKSKALDVDLIAVTVGPGLEPALWEGINFAKDLAKKISTKGGSASGRKK